MEGDSSLANTGEPSAPYADLATPKPPEDDMRREEEGQQAENGLGGGQGRGVENQKKGSRRQMYRMSGFWGLQLQKVSPEKRKVGLVLATKGDGPSVISLPSPAPLLRRKRMRWKKPETVLPLLLEEKKPSGKLKAEPDYLGGFEPEVRLEEGEGVLAGEGNEANGDFKYEEGNYYQDDYCGGEGDYYENYAVKGEADQDHKMKNEGMEDEEPVMLHYAPNIDEVMYYEGYLDTTSSGKVEQDDEDAYQEEEDDDGEEDYDDDEEEYRPRRRERKPGSRSRFRKDGTPRKKYVRRNRVWPGGYKPTSVWEDPGDEPAVKQDSNATELYMMRVEDYMVAEAAKQKDREILEEGEEGLKLEIQEGAVKQEEPDSDESDEENEEDEDEESEDAKGDETKKKKQKRLSENSHLADRRLYGCPYCGFVNRKREWVNHLRKKHAEKKLIFCQKNRLCFAPFQSQEMLDKHMLEVHVPQRTDRECPKCDKIYKFPCELKAHMNSHLDVSIT